MTMKSDSKNINKPANKIQWSWIPRVFVFFISIVFGWVIFWKKTN
ncbi:MAG TPA: hypothetical protein PKE38_06540 [Ignavibacteriaceae bacterium]|nr:hypothetical protein [Ignavibacteriaceae bacterium]HRN25439.1 hypothetical protein [Ignavibacteriaceae bacterium]HRP91594.1 hypothetical protein [Ignavibacteriaceae bacterium]